ncbi:MAG: hypothetical protein GXZ11_07845 [Tissierellia bacterium]|nr:hypothetical protein [Tissierellia bacterium]
MKKRLFTKYIAAIFMVCILLLKPVYSQGQEPIKIWVDGVYLTSDVSAFIENERTMVPLRVISENLGYGVKWDDSSKSAIITKLGYDKAEDNFFEGTHFEKVLVLSIGNQNAYLPELTAINEQLQNALAQKSTTVEAKLLMDNATTAPIEVAPLLKEDRTFVPLRFIAEQFGQKVNWDNDNRTVVIGDGYVPEAASSPAIPASFVEATVTSITDGDTVVVNIGGNSFNLRFIGIDCPELNPNSGSPEPFAQEATDYTKAALLGKTIWLQKDVSETDRYDRLLRYIWTEAPASDNPTAEEVKNHTINAKLVGLGLAYSKTYKPDNKYNHIFDELQASAKEQKLGIWSKEQEANLVPVSDDVQHDPTGQNRIKGNISNSGEKIYHEYGQRDYYKTIITESKGER